MSEWLVKKNMKEESLLLLYFNIPLCTSLMYLISNDIHTYVNFSILSLFYMDSVESNVFHYDS